MHGTVYTVAFVGEEFLMVRNTKRNGWEMPGGHIENGEGPEEAAKREYLEESGYSVDIIGITEMHGCFVCAGILKDKVTDGEMEWRMFSHLPKELAFDREEYDEVMEWARSAVCVVRPAENVTHRD